MAAKTYELRVYNAAGTVVEFVLTSLAAAPVLPGPIVDPVRGRTQTQSWSFRVVDAAGAITSRLADPASGRIWLVGRIIEVHESVDGAAMALVGTGRIAGLTEADGPGEWTLLVDDERWVERNSTIFEKQHATAAIYPPMLSRAWAGITPPIELQLWAAAAPLSSSGSAKRVGLVRWVPLSSSLAGFIADDLIASPVAGRSDGQGNFRTLRLETQDGTIFPVITFEKEFGGNAFTDDVHSVKPDEGRHLTLWTWDPGGLLTEGVLVRLIAPDAEPSPALPAHSGMSGHVGYDYPYGATDPFQFVQDMYDLKGVRYDPVALDALKGRYPPLYIRATGPENLARCLEDRVYGPLGVVPFIDAQGRVAPRSVRQHELSEAEYGALPELDAGQVSDHPTMDISGRELVNAIEFRRASYQLAATHGPRESWATRFVGIESRRAADDFPADLLLESEQTLSRTYASAGGAQRAEPLEVDLRAFYAGAASRADIEIADRFAQEIFERFGDGPIRGSFPAMAGAPPLEPGALVRLNQTSIKGANPAANARAGLRIVQILQRTRAVDGPSYTYLDVGPALQPLPPPTVAIARSAVDPKHTADVTVSNVPAGATAIIELSYIADFSEIVHRRASLSAGVVQIGRLASGRTVYARAASSSPTRLTHGWGLAASVTMEALAAPTNLAVTIAGRSIALSWTNTESAYPIIPVQALAPLTPEPWLRWPAQLPAGSTRTVFDGLAAGTHVLGVRYVDAYGGESPTATIQTSTAAANALAPPQRVRWLQVALAPVTAGTPAADSSVGTGVQISVRRAAPHTYARVQLATDELFAAVELEVVLSPESAETFLPTPLDGVLRYVRVREERDGFTESAWSSVLQGYPTVLLSTPPLEDPTSINYLGEFAAAPADPQVNDVYHNTTDGTTYIWTGSEWGVIARDGAPGTGTGLEVRYSGPAAGANISGTFNPALHVYMQIRRTDQAWPADWVPIVGEDGAAGADGVYFDYRFRVATTQPATPTGTNPSGWFDAPPAYDPATGNLLWMTRALKNAADGNLLGTWSTPVTLTGPIGPEGPEGPEGPVGPPGDTFGHPPTAHIVALAATDLTMDLRYSGTLGTDATGPLQWRRRIDREGGPEGLWGPGAGDGWVEASGANALPFTEAGILRDPRWDRIVVLEVRDANGQLASARFVIMPADIRRGGIRGYDAIEEPVPGGGYNIAPTIEDSGGREIRRFYGKPLPGDPDHIGSIQDGGGYRKPTINEATGGGRAYSALDSSNELVTGLKPIALVDGRSARDVRLLAEKPGHNLLVNPGFEAGDVGWGTGAGFSIINDPANARTGNFVVRYQSDGAGGPNFSPGLNIKLSPGERFRLGMWTRTPAGVGLMRLAMRFYDANGALLSTITIASAAPSVGWTYTSGIVTAPAGAVEGRFDIGENASDNTATPWYIDDVSVVRVVEANEAIRGSTTLDGILQNVTDAGHAGSGMQDSGGRAINRFFGKALTGTPDTLDGVPDGISFARTNHDEKVGADRAFDALDVSNRLTTGTTGSATDNGGRAINRFYGKPLFGDPDNFGSIADGGGYAKTTTNERTGAARGFAALDSSNRLATAVLGTATIDGETAARVRGQATSPSQNLLPREAGQEYTIGVEGTAGTDATLDAMGLAPGDVISISADLKVNDGVGRYIRLRVFRADNSWYFHGSGTQSSSAAYTRVKLENITIPADAARVSVYIDNAGTTSSTFQVRRAMLNRGPVALPYEEPPFRPNREGAGDILRGSLRGDITAEQAGGTIVKSIPKGVVGGTCYHNQAVEFDEPYQNPPKIIFLVPAAIEQRAKWGTKQQVDNGVASGNMPPNSFIRPRPVAAGLNASGFWAELYIEAKSAPVARTADFSSSSGVALGEATGAATPLNGQAPSIDNTYRCRVRFDLTNNHPSQPWSGTVVAVLEVNKNASGWEEIGTAAPAFNILPGGSEQLTANLSGSVTDIAGGDDQFRVVFKSITPAPGFSLQTLTVIEHLNWTQDTGAQFASMTPDGAADAIPYLVIADS